MSKREFIIPFVGLKVGIHEFEFDINDSFFENIEYSIVHGGNVKVRLLLEKKETMLIGNYFIEGTVKKPCDRCNDEVNVEVEGEFRLIYKFDTEPSEDETLVTVYPEEFEINIESAIYEFITVSMPGRSIHPKGECDEEMVKVLREYTVNSIDDNDEFDNDEFDEDEFEEEEDFDEDYEDDEDDDNDGFIDPRWEALNKLK